MPYPSDPGGRFQSDVHRRVLAHLSHPDDTYGWSEPALLERMRPDRGTSIETTDELHDVLVELEEEGLANKPAKDVWRMTQEGLDTLNMGIVDEPEPGAARVGPATIGVGAGAGATSLDGSEAETDTEQ